VPGRGSRGQGARHQVTGCDASVLAGARCVNGAAGIGERLRLWVC